MNTATPVQPEALFTGHRIPRGEGHVYARHYPGTGPAFVLMHGLPDNLHIYDALVPYLLKAGRQVVTFDFLGFGQSSKVAGTQYSFAQQLGDLEAVVAGLELDQIVPVAHDAAGPTAINFTLAHPNQVAQLQLLNTLYAPSKAMRLPELVTVFADPALAVLANAFLQSPEQFGWLLGIQQARFLGDLPEHQQARFMEILPALIGNNFRQQPSAAAAFAAMNADLFAEVGRNGAALAAVAELRTPVRIIWGSADSYLNTGLAEELQQQFHNASLAQVEAGHWLQIDAPEAVAALMLQ